MNSTTNLELLTEITCRKLNSHLNLNLNYVNLEHSDYGYANAIQIMHYYRLKDMFDLYNENKRYKRKYYFKYYDYESLHKSGFNKFELGFMIHDLRTMKNVMINEYITNYYFYKYDKNVKMCSVCGNLIKTMINYVSYFDNLKKKEASEIDPNYFNPDFENHYLNDMIYAFNLYYTMLNSESFLSDSEMSNLINEEHDIKDIEKISFELKNKQS